MKSGAEPDVQWADVERLTYGELVMQRTNLAPHRHVARIMERLMDIQKEIDSRDKDAKCLNHAKSDPNYWGKAKQP